MRIANTSAGANERAKNPVNSFDRKTPLTALLGITRKRDQCGVTGPSYGLYLCSYTAIRALHGLQEDVFERVALEVEPPDLHGMRRRERIEFTHANAVVENELHLPTARHGALATKVVHGFGEWAGIAGHFEFDETAICPTLLFEIAVHSEASVLQYEYLFAGFLDIT
jgi:hypothetical protein